MNTRQLALDACDTALKNGIAELTKTYIAAAAIGDPADAARRLKAGLENLKSGYGLGRAMVDQVFSEGPPAS